MVDIVLIERILNNINAELRELTFFALFVRCIVKFISN